MAVDALLLKSGSGPASEPVTVAEAKAHMRVSHAADDTYIGNLLKVVTQDAEEYTSRRFVTQTWLQYHEEWPCGLEIQLKLGPVSAVNSVKYYDQDGQQQTFDGANYELEGQALPPYLRLKDGAESWPTLQALKPRAVEIEFVVGYGAAAAVPWKVKQALMIAAAELYWKRVPAEKGVAFGAVERLLYSEKIWYT